MQLGAFKNRPREVCPIVASAALALAVGLLLPRRDRLVAELGDEQPLGILDELLRLLGAHIGQIGPFDLAGLAAVPGIGFAGVFVGAEHHYLLAVTEQLDLFGIAFRTARRHEALGDLFEGYVCA